MIKKGQIVRYAPGFCYPDEEKYLHLVLENRLNPVTGKMSRWLISTLNTSLFLAPTEEVEDYMISPTGFCMDECGNIERVEVLEK